MGKSKKNIKRVNSSNIFSQMFSSNSTSRSSSTSSSFSPKSLKRTIKTKNNYHTFNNSIFPGGKEPRLKVKEYDSSYDTIMTIDLGRSKKNRYLVYYVGKDTDDKKNSKEQFNTNVYRNIDYYVIKLDSKGKGVLKFKCPPIYIIKGKGTINERHVHYILSNEKRNKWLEKVYEEEVKCEIDIKMVDKLVREGKTLFINALPYKYFVKDRIPDSISLPHDDLFKKLDKKDVMRYIQDSHPRNKRKELRRDNRTLPIVCYCYSNTCEADCDLKEKLESIGFKNILLYSGGITDYRKHHKK